MKRYEVNCFPRKYGVAAYAIGAEESIERLRLPENKVIGFPENSTWAGLVARRIGGFRNMGEVRDWCSEHRYPAPILPCIPLYIGFEDTPRSGTEGVI